MAFSIGSTGDWKRTQSWLKDMARGSLFSDLDRYGQAGVAALASATPTDSSLTANSWDYKVSTSGSGASIEWFNTNAVGSANIAILLQYGHGTGTGGYVKGRDYINPAVKPIFDQIEKDVWKKVTANG